MLGRGFCARGRSETVEKASRVFKAAPTLAQFSERSELRWSQW